MITHQQQICNWCTLFRMIGFGVKKTIILNFYNLQIDILNSDL